MLKQANFAIYLILFGSLFAISFLFVQNVSKIWNDNYFYEAKCRVNHVYLKQETSKECFEKTKLAHCWKLTHSVIYHFQNLYHTAFIHTYLIDKPNLKDYPEEHPEPDTPHHIANKVKCYFNTKDWQHLVYH
eukprot:gene2956-4966_t